MEVGVDTCLYEPLLDVLLKEVCRMVDSLLLQSL